MPNETLTLTIDVTSDELASIGITRSFTVTFEDAEQNSRYYATKTYSFETGLDGWEVVQGTFARKADEVGGANFTKTYVASSSLVDGSCDEIHSPVVKLKAGSTITVYNQFATEPISDAWYDRANLGLVDVATGKRSTVVPDGGRPYVAFGPNGVCVTAGQVGWAGPGPGWLPSSWSPAALAGFNDGRKRVRLDVGYGTDPNVSGLGFWFDEVTITDFEEQVPDDQPNP